MNSLRLYVYKYTYITVKRILVEYGTRGPAVRSFRVVRLIRSRFEFKTFVIKLNARRKVRRGTGTFSAGGAAVALVFFFFFIIINR